ncbi:MAG: hypothetical protein ABSH11_05630 [Verrucomicrobiota bacterium]
MALFFLGFSAWCFFRQLNFSPTAAALGALAAALNSTFFASACWGVAGQLDAFSMDFLAMALVLSISSATPPLTRWMRLALAGLAVGVNVMEAADIGAIFSLFVAAFVIYLAFAGEMSWTRVERIVVCIVVNLGFVLLLFVILFAGHGTNYYLRGKLMVLLLVVPAFVWNWAIATRYTLANRLAHSIARVGVIAVFAGFIATQTVVALVGSQISGIAGTGQDTKTKVQHWDWATQWSVPKIEALGLFIPGLFGYRMDTPKDMMEFLQESYKGGNYWGGVGRDPVIDRFFAGGKEGSPPPGLMRFTGGGNYAGVLVTLVALWAMTQSLRRQNPAFTVTQRRFIWFWSLILIVSLLLALGRFAPFYKWLYMLPYASTMRNPCKFLAVFSWALVILFAYGIHGLSRRYLEISAANSASPLAQLKNWRMKARGFDRNWTLVCVLAVIGSTLGWLIYAMEKPGLVRYLQKVGFPDEDMAKNIAAFSIGQVGWFIMLFALAVGLCTLVIAGIFAGRRAKLGGILLGTLLVMDLGRANLPYIIHWDYKQKYEIGSLNPIVDFLRNKPYEHRVAYGLPRPLPTPPQFESFNELYLIEWAQHHFPYYNIQSLDKIQMSRMPADLEAFEGALRIGIRQDGSGQWIVDPGTFTRVGRLWELTNTRYLLGPAALLDLLNEQFDPGQRRFRIVQCFTIVLKPGVNEFHQQLEELTVVPKDNGDYALIEFPGALPRVKLYSAWQVSTNDTATLKTLASTNFNPWQTVLVSTPLPGVPAANATDQNSSTVDFKRYVPDDPVFRGKKNHLWKQCGYCYAPKDIMFDAKTTTPSVLLLNDRFDPHWHVWVDGKPAELLRCNFIMRGVFLSPGAHTVEFQFKLPNGSLYVTLVAIAVGIFLCGFLWFASKQSEPDSRPWGAGAKPIVANKPARNDLKR